MCFDSTAVNIGCLKGICVLLEELFEKRFVKLGILTSRFRNYIEGSS